MVDMEKIEILAEYPLDILVAMQEFVLQGNNSKELCPICKIMIVHYDRSKRDVHSRPPWCVECLQFEICQEFKKVLQKDEQKGNKFALVALEKAIKYRKKNYKD